MKIFISILLVVLTSKLFSQNWIQLSKDTGLNATLIKHSVKEYKQYLGQKIHANGNKVFVSAHSDSYDSNYDNLNYLSGVCYYYELVNNELVLKQRITPDKRTMNSEFGMSISSNNDFLFIGSPKYNDGKGVTSGRVFVFKNINDKYQQIQELITPEQVDFSNFGISIASTNTHLFITANNKSKKNPKVKISPASVFVYKNNNGSWEYLQTIESPNKISSYPFGEAITVTEDFLFVGDTYGNALGKGNITKPGCGSVYAYKLTGDKFIFKSTLRASDLNDTQLAAFGSQVLAIGNTLLVGAPMKSIKRKEIEYKKAGAVYVYKYENDKWIEKKIIYDSESKSSSDANFGCSLSMNEKLIAIGAKQESRDPNNTSSVHQAGNVYLYNINGDDINFQEIVTSFKRRQYEQFGLSTALTNDNLLVGSRDYIGKGTNAIFHGALYNFYNTKCSQKLSITAVLPYPKLGKEYNRQIKVEGMSNPTFKIIKGELPKGLSLSATGLIVGTCNEVFDGSIIVEAKEANCIIRKEYAFKVKAQ